MHELRVVPLESPHCLTSATTTNCLHWIVIGPSWQACSRPPLAQPPYMVTTSAQRWSVFVRTWACVHSTMSCLTSWVWRSTCGSTPDSKAWLRRTYARRWTSQYNTMLLQTVLYFVLCCSMFVYIYIYYTYNKLSSSDCDQHLLRDKTW